MRLVHGLMGVLLYLLASAASAAPSAALGYTPKYPANFSHFDYVNPAAPKGGTFNLGGMGSFDGLNPFVLKGNAADLLSTLVFESLMEQSADEPYSLYGLLADDITLAPDKLSVTFHINPHARFANGDAITAKDVKYSFDTLKSEQAHPQYRIRWSDIKRAVVIDPARVRFEFVKINPELYLVVGQVPVFSSKWGQGKPFDQIVLDAPIGSGPYVVDNYDLGKNISYRRSPNYWAKDLGVRRGMYNFDRINLKYFKDETTEFEALKAHQFDFFFDNYSKRWARDYTGPQFTNGQIKRVLFKHSNNAGAQGFFFNLRRDNFKDVRVRKAIALAFDFEWSNENLFFNQYVRVNSYFSNSTLAATGLPQGDELALLEPFRAQLPPEVFTTVWQPPTTTPPNSLRGNLRQAKALLEQAGWRVQDNVLKNAQGKPLEFEILLVQKAFERIVAPFAKNLTKLGIQVTYRAVDVSLYKRKVETHDFDVIVHTVPESQSPGNEQFGYWHSSAAEQEGSDNYSGVQSPVIDALVDKIIYAPDRQHLVTATHALDRVLLNGWYMVPNWYIAVHRVAYWNEFSHPKDLPLYYEATNWALSTWWATPPRK